MSAPLNKTCLRGSEPVSNKPADIRKALREEALLLKEVHKQRSKVWDYGLNKCHTCEVCKEFCSTCDLIEWALGENL
jgi:hypothetical protein